MWTRCGVMWKARCMLDAVALLFYDFFYTKCEFKQQRRRRKRQAKRFIMHFGHISFALWLVFCAVSAYFLRSDIYVVFCCVFFVIFFYFSFILHLFAKRTGMIKKSFIFYFIVQLKDERHHSSDDSFLLHTCTYSIMFGIQIWCTHFFKKSKKIVQSQTSNEKNRTVLSN